MLSSMIDKAFIQLNVKATDWQDAIKLSAQPLLKAGKIAESYIEKMIDIALETGPYIVIAKNVALPHAPPDAGVYQTAMSITVLEHDVHFGNPDNDPVKYLFCLSATDSTSHLEALAELVDLLEDQNFFQLLNQARNRTEVLDYVINKTKNR